MSYAIGPLSISVFFMLEVGLVKPQLFEMYAQNWHGFFMGLLAFFFGFLFVYSGSIFWQTVSKFKWLYISLASILFLIRFTGFESISNMYLTALESVSWILGVFGIGYNYLDTKQKLFNQFYGVIPFGRIIHSSCLIDPTAKINEGTVLYPGVIVDANVKIESNVLVNLGCCIAHDSTIGHSSFLSPRVAIAGFVNIGQRCILGINSTFKDNIELDNEIQIGAGTVVVKSLKEKDIYIGVPARKIR